MAHIDILLVEAWRSLRNVLASLVYNG